jgi:uncharacterized membrane protein
MNTNETARVSKTRLCILLVCYAGRKGAAHARGELTRVIGAEAGTVVDDVVLSVDGKRRASVHDPRRVVAGTLTAALTWGLFGLVAGGLSGLAIWAILGALCGGANAYFTEHVLATNDLKQIGERLQPNSSAIVAFVENANADGLLARAEKKATVASAASIAPDLSAQVSESGPHVTHQNASALTMLLVRFAGERTASTQLRTLDSDAHLELIFEAPSNGRVRVVSPTQGVAAMAKSDIISWGGFGLVYGFLVGLFSNGGVLGGVDKGILKGLAWAAFGLAAGALYGLWAGRAASSRRVKRLRPLLPPDTSTAIVWIAGPVPHALDKPIQSSSQHLTLEFHPYGSGAVLQNA